MAFGMRDPHPVHQDDKSNFVVGRPSAGACFDVRRCRRCAPGRMVMRATHARGERMKRTRIVGRDSVPSVIRSLRTEATRAPEVFGGSCLQRSALRLDLFSLSCPRLEVLPDRRLAIVDPVRSTCTLAASGYTQGTHHLAQRHAWRASAIGRRGTRGSEGAECFRVETRCRKNRFGNASRRAVARARHATWRAAVDQLAQAGLSRNPAYGRDAHPDGCRVAPLASIALIR